jgi:hypothetical protein
MNRLTKLASILSTFACVATSGCYFQATLVDDPAPVVVEDPPPATPVPSEVIIDTDAAMVSYPGEQVGVYVQYSYGGHWNVYTTCDTYASDLACDFDILIQPEPGLSIWNVEGWELDSADGVTFYDDESVNLTTRTTYGTDGISFDADPGASIRIDVFLDGEARPDYVFVVSYGEVLDGVPTNPVDLIPASY